MSQYHSGGSGAMATPAQPLPVGVPLNAYKAVHEHISRILSQVSGMKALLMDAESMGIIGVVYSQSDALAKEVFLTESVDVISARSDLHLQSFTHLIAVAIVQPSPATLHALTTLLATPRYIEYHLFFTNLLPAGYLDALSKEDVHDYVKSVHEYYIDFYALSPSLYHLNNTSTTCTARLHPSTRVPLATAMSAQFDREVAGVIALLLSQKKRPDIRYAASSHQAQTIAQSVAEVIRREAELFAFPQEGASTLLLLLDRRDDPVTPLLSQWTYQAMVHELLTIHNNRIDMRRHNPSYLSTSTSNGSTPALGHREEQMKKDLQELVLSPQQDDFFKQNQFANFGEMGERIKQLVTHYQSVTKSNVKLDSIEALQDFVDKYPQYRQLSGNVSKHVTLMTELSSIVNKRRLMRVSALEQEIVCGNAHEHPDLVHRIHLLLTDQPETAGMEGGGVGSSDRTFIDFLDKLRVVVLYALRYASHEASRLAAFKDTLAHYALDARDKERLVTVDKMLEYYYSNYASVQTVNPSNNPLLSSSSSTARRATELFENSKLLSMFKAVASELKGVENIYTQHKPLLVSCMSKLMSGDLRLQDFPFVDRDAAKVRYKNIIVYMVGGTTYEEHAALEALMRVGPIGGGSADPLAPPTTTRSTSKESVAAAGGSGGAAGGAGEKRKGFNASDVLSSVKSTAKDVGSALGQGAHHLSSLGLAGATAVQSAIKFNPRDYRVILGGSTILNSATFMQEVWRVEDDIIGAGGEGAAADSGSFEVGSIEAAVNRQAAGQARGRGRGRGGYAAVPWRGASPRGGPMRGRGGGPGRGGPPRGGLPGGRGGYAPVAMFDAVDSAPVNPAAARPPATDIEPTSRLCTSLSHCEQTRCGSVAEAHCIGCTHTGYAPNAS